MKGVIWFSFMFYCCFLAQNVAFGQDIQLKSGAVEQQTLDVKGTTDAPVASFEVKNFCAGDTTFFTNKSYILNGTIQFYLWKFGDNIETYEKNPYHIYQKPGSYVVELTVKSADQLSHVVKNTITILPRPAISFTYDPGISIYENERVKIEAVGTFDKIKWSNGTTSNPLIVNIKGKYAATVTDINGCATYLETQEIKIISGTVKDTLSLVVENNILTPNGDGFNDFLIVKGLAGGEIAHDVEVFIYNVWGVKVYETKKYSNDFDGTKLDAGTYYYHIRSLGRKGKTGFVDIIK